MANQLRSPALKVGIQNESNMDGKISKKPQTRTQFLFHLGRNILVGTVAIIFSLGVGMYGYHYLEHMPWIDAYVNASMILSGMGPVNELSTEAGKLFAGTYALFSGVFFLVVIALILAPVVHRFFHELHLEDTK